VITIRIGVQDLTTIKSVSNLATSIANTYFISTAAQGLVGNPLQEIMATEALQAKSLLADAVGPILQEFILDLNTGQLSLTFI